MGQMVTKPLPQRTPNSFFFFYFIPPYFWLQAERVSFTHATQARNLFDPFRLPPHVQVPYAHTSCYVAHTPTSIGRHHRITYSK